MPTFEDRVRSIPPVNYDGFNCSKSAETFIDVADTLVAKGIHEDDVIYMLTNLFEAVVNELGS
jgi:hypothetical protein